MDMPQDPPVDNNSQANPDTDTSSYTPNNIKWGSKDRSDGRIWIRSELGNNFYPEEVVRSAITKIFKENFGGAWSCWKDAKQNEEVPLLWFNDFKAKFKWLANDEANIKKSFNSRGSLALKNALFKVRSGEDKGEWVGVDNLKQLEVKWKEEKWQKNSLTNKQNRQSKVGHNVHSGGSISARVHNKKMVSDSFCLNYSVKMFILTCCLLVMF
ncbi:uncharacterized protein [Medicago truncatula]|uniref:uncharacterized protein isoform X1 n=1 Tax=Medicago truncatula TaxID=3880 RepID=UPI001967103A|nr:uncharacterized protein LOC120576895 isoform X1 [Medicago truncatula]